MLFGSWFGPVTIRSLHDETDTFLFVGIWLQYPSSHGSVENGPPKSTKVIFQTPNFPSLNHDDGRKGQFCVAVEGMVFNPSTTLDNPVQVCLPINPQIPVPLLQLWNSVITMDRKKVAFVGSKQECEFFQNWATEKKIRYFPWNTGCLGDSYNGLF